MHHREKSDYGFLLLLGVGFLLRLFFIGQSREFLISHFLVDDAYYYFQIGRNIAHGFGSTFDGMHLTNGYHPLWMAVVASTYRLCALVSDNSDSPIRVLLGLAALGDVLSAYAIFRLCQLMQLPRRIQLLASALFLFNPWTIVHGLNGLESAAANAFLLVSVWQGIAVLQSKPTSRKLFVLGLLLAVTVLTRLDYAILLLPFGLWLLWHFRTSVSHIFLLLIPGMTLGLLWAWWSMRTFGIIVPHSGLAFTLVNKTLFFYKERSMMTVFLWSLYQWVQSLDFAARVSGLWWGLWGILLWSGMKMVQIVRLSRLYSSVWCGWCLVLIGFFSYTFLQGAIRWSGREWYFSLGTALVAVSIAFLLSRWKRGQTGGVLVLMCCMWFANIPVLSSRLVNQMSMLHAVDRVAAVLPTGARVGMFNAGIVGYYAPFSVVNLDGLVNLTAFRALQEHVLLAAVAQMGLTHILDYDIALSYRYAPFWGVNSQEVIHPILTIEEQSTYHGSALRLHAVTL